MTPTIVVDSPGADAWAESLLRQCTDSRVDLGVAARVVVGYADAHFAGRWMLFWKAESSVGKGE